MPFKRDWLRQRTASSVRELVTACYRVFLSRDPESQDAVDEKVRAFVSFEETLKSFAESQEFKSRPKPGVEIKDTWRAPIEVEVAPQVLGELLARTQSQWAELGQKRPYWSVITRDGVDEAADGGETRRSFYASGVHEANLLDLFEARCDVRIRREICLELGAGVGRVTWALSNKFSKVLAADISDSMLHECSNALKERGVRNVECRLIEDMSSIQNMPDFDFFFSRIVLQHNSPPVQLEILKTLIPKIRKGGGFVFQAQTYIEDYEFDALRHLGSVTASIEMHALPMRSILEVLQSCGCAIKEVLSDECTGIVGSHCFLGVR